MNFYRCYRVRSGRRTLVVGRVNVTVWCLSVCLSVCLSHLSTAAAACGGFAAVCPAGRISIDGCTAGAQLQLRAVSRCQLA